MPVRITCDLDGLTGCWMDVSSQWSGRDLAALLDASNSLEDDGLYAMLRRKVEACRLELLNGTTIETPADITSERMLDADVALGGWLSQGLYLAIAQRRVLGNASARTLRPANGAGKATVTPAQTQATT